MDKAQGNETLTLAQRVRYLMDRAGHTKVSQAHRHTDVGYATLHGILSGERENPDITNLRKIAKAYNVSLGWLTGDEPEEGTYAGGFQPWDVSSAEQIIHKYGLKRILVEHPEYKDPKIRTDAAYQEALEIGLHHDLSEMQKLLAWIQRETAQS